MVGYKSLFIGFNISDQTTLTYLYFLSPKLCHKVSYCYYRFSFFKKV